MRSCSNCGNTVPEDAHHCPHCGKPLLEKHLSPVPFYLTGFLLLVVSGILLGNYLKNHTPLNPPIDANFPTSTLSQEVQNAAQAVATNTMRPTATFPATSAPPTPPVPSENPVGKIVYTCQIFKDNNRNQICLMNADGSNQRRLTTDDHADHFYSSLSPDGKTIIFSSNETGAYEIYEMDFDGRQTLLTSLGNLFAPEISPDGKSIVFTNAAQTYSSIWIMDRNGDNPHLVYSENRVDALDPTWSPDGQKILFARGIQNNKKLYTVNINGTGLKIVNDQFITRGRSDWSPDGTKIAGYTGDSWQRKIYVMNYDGSGLFELLANGNVQAPSFSPDGGWVGFTGYIDNMHNENGCEIYILRLSDKKLQRLTNNDYCDWQPRWGP